MSGINGDKARFHRKRKSKIARRARNNKLFQNSPPKSEARPSRAKRSAVSE